MDVIKRAIEQKLHITDNPQLKGQTWDAFEKAAEQKKIWIFGAGKIADILWNRYGESLTVAGAVDNDKRKEGKALKNYTGITVSNAGEEVTVQSVNALCTVNPDEVVVVIASVRYYEEMASQVKALGIDNIFVILIMEANDSNEGSDRKTIEKREEASVETEYVNEYIKYPIEKNKILVCIGNYGGHGRQISWELAKMSADLDIVWAIDHQDIEIPAGVRHVFIGDLKEYIRELETAYIWIFGEPIPEFAEKRPEQIYIQTKHWASITLKKFYWDVKDYLEIPSVRKNYLHDIKAMDYILVGSEFDEASCRSGFDFHGECIYVGSPRTDILFKQGIREKVFSYYGINNNVHTLLYCPTYRNISHESTLGRMKNVDLDFELLRETLTKKFGGEWIILLRIHPYVAMESAKVQCPPFVIDTTFYNESQELVAAAEIVITDYSSIMFEPAFVGKPVFLYAPDREEYVGRERDLLIDYDTLPFPIAESNEDLMNYIMNYNECSYQQDLQSFFDKYGVHEDGHASERAAGFILQLYNSDRIKKDE